MSESKQSLKPQKDPILQKDLSFSNQIFKKTFLPDQPKSNKQSQQHFHKFTIPPLIKYTDFPLSKQNLHQQVPTFDENQQQSYVKENPLYMFTRKKSFGRNFNEQSASNFVPQKSIPPLSELQKMIFKKYQKNDDLQKVIEKNIESNENNSKKGSHQSKVHFDKTDKLYQASLNLRDSLENVFNIDSLEQSRIANQSIQKHNNWMLTNVNDESQFIDNFRANPNIQKKTFSPNNQSFRIMNPLTLVSNSLHTSNLPEFIEDDSISQNDETLNLSQRQRRMSLGDYQQREGTKINKNTDHRFSRRKQIDQESQKRGSSEFSRKKEKPIHEITMSLFSHYLEELLQKQFDEEQKRKDKEQDAQQSLINQQQQKLEFDNITSKSSPINYSSSMNNSPAINNRSPTNNKTARMVMMDQTKSMSEANPISRSLDLSLDSYSQHKLQSHFIHDKNPQEIIASLFKDDKKAQLFIKYLQIQISSNPQSPFLSNNYELLSCILSKIQSITDKNKIPKSPIMMAQSILQIYTSKKGQTTEGQKQVSSKPQIIRSKNQIKIDFDPFLKYQKTFLNEKISILKKALQQKNKQTQLIKLTYDGIVHNYAITLQNLARKAQYSQNDVQDQVQEQKQASFSKTEVNSYFQDKLQAKNLLDISGINRSSMEGNIIHRKATFGKVSSSFRGSGTVTDP